MTINLNFFDLCNYTQNYIIDKAIAEVMSDDDAVQDIIDMFGYAVGTIEFDKIVREKAEQKIYEFNYVFNP